MLETYLQFLDMGFYEVTFAFEGIADENVWKRPADGLLSIGEVAGHIVYWEAGRLGARLAGAFGEHFIPDLSQSTIKSPLLDHRFSYYPTTLASPPTNEQRAMTAKEVCAELIRIHQETIELLKEYNPDLSDPLPGCPPNYTYAEALKYAAFHIAYHTGQMYTVRHLLGDKTEDN